MHVCVHFSKVMGIKNLHCPTKQHNVKTDSTVILELIKMAIWEISYVRRRVIYSVISRKKSFMCKKSNCLTFI